MNKKYFKFISFLSIFVIIFIIASLLSSFSFSSVDTLASTLDPNSFIEVGFPYYNGKDSLISSNVGNLPVFSNGLSINNNTNYYFSNGNFIRNQTGNTSTSMGTDFYVDEVNYKNITYKNLCTNFIISSSSSSYWLVWKNLHLKANTTYTFSFICFYVQPYAYSSNFVNNCWITNDSDSSIDLFNISYSSLPSINNSNPYLFYLTFTPTFDCTKLHIQFRYNTRASYFLVEGTSPCFIPSSSSSDICTLNFTSLNVNPNSPISLLHNSEIFYNGSLNIYDYTGFTNLPSLSDKGSLSAYFKFYNTGTFLIPLSFVQQSDGFKLSGRKYFRNDSTLVSYLDIDLIVSTDTILNLKYYRSDNDTSYVTLSNIVFSLTYYLDTYSSSVSYNTGFLDGRNSLNETITSLSDTITSQTAQIDHLNYLINNSTDYSFYSLFGAIYDVPVRTARGLLNFNVFGVNMFSFFTALLTIALVLFVWRIFTKGG